MQELRDSVRSDVLRVLLRLVPRKGRAQGKEAHGCEEKGRSRMASTIELSICKYQSSVVGQPDIIGN